MATVSYNQPTRCAHCGGHPKIRTSRHRGNIGGHYIECLGCGISTRHYPKLSDAVTAWNRRPYDCLPDGLKKVMVLGRWIERNEEVPNIAERDQES